MKMPKKYDLLGHYEKDKHKSKADEQKKILDFLDFLVSIQQLINDAYSDGCKTGYKIGFNAGYTSGANDKLLLKNKAGGSNG